MFKKIGWIFALSLLSLSVVSCEDITYGVTVRDSKTKFSIFADGSFAEDIVEEEDGSVSWVATASNGAGGGVAFYLNPDRKEINIENYESIDLEFDYAAVEGKWSSGAQTPSFVMRILPWDSTGIFGGYEDLEYFDSETLSGSITHHIDIPSDFVDKIKTSSDYDAILGFVLKFNDYQRGNAGGDQLKVTLKNVIFNAKEGAAEDKPFDDGLTDDQRGTVVEINYPTRDYTVEESALTDADRYEKHAWVYLPAGYDASDVDTKYPLFVLLHGFGQNENTWGLTNKGRGGKIKGFMDRGMSTGEVEKFILVTVTGVASKNWGPNGSGTDTNGFNSFKGELRDDLLPYMKANFNIKDGRDNAALAGLSMGGGQTMNIGVKECLDLFSNYASFSISMGNGDEYTAEIDAKPEFEGLKIHNLYINCGDADYLCIGSFQSYIDSMSKWDRVENFDSYVFPAGTHDFPVWYKGFNDFIQMIFKSNETPVTVVPVTEVPVTEAPVTKTQRTVVKKVTKCRVKKN